VARILIVEDDRDIAELIAHALGKAGHATERCRSGSDGLATVRASLPDLVVLDLMLPGLDGLSVCQALRAEATTAAVPILMLTARGEESDRVAGLEIGADDYVTKPFSPKELVARIGALLRRAGRAAGPPAPVLRYRSLVIDVGGHRVTDARRDVKLTAKEFLLLRYLIEHKGRVLSRDVLLTDVWGYQYTGGTRTVDVHVRRLREKLPLLNDAIETVKQFGYKLGD
jgi:DNA-binding response OmpR family regulator